MQISFERINVLGRSEHVCKPKNQMNINVKNEREEVLREDECVKERWCEYFESILNKVG